MIKKSIIYIFSFFCTTVMFLSYAVAAPCTTTADCLYNQYCIIGGMDGGTCSYCTRPDNSDWDPNGTRNGDGETSCPWKCNDTYYKDGNECKRCDDAGKYWDTTSNTCKTAEANYFSPAGDINKYQCPYGSVTLDDSRTDYSLSFTDPKYHDSIDDCYWYRNKIYDGKNQHTQFIQWYPLATDHKHHIPLSASIKAKGLRDLGLAAE